MATGNGSAELRALALRLRAEGEGRMLREVRAELRAGAEPLKDEVRSAARSQLPRAGGLNEYVAEQQITVSIRTGASTAGVRLTTRAPATEQTDKGYVRHPTFDRRGEGDWKTQLIPRAKGWWSVTLRGGAPRVTPGLVGVIKRVADRIQGRGI